MKKKIGFLFVLVLLAFCGSIMVGKTFFSFDLWLALWQQTLTASQSLIFFDFRLPRAVLALIAGSAFGFSGFLLQGVTRNELADASILGINNGAGLCVMLYLGFYAQGSQLLPLIGMIGGLLAALLVYAIAYKQRQLLSMERILLSGIAVNAGLASASLLLTVQLSKERYSFVTAWLSGTIWGTSWIHDYTFDQFTGFWRRTGDQFRCSPKSFAHRFVVRSDWPGRKQCWLYWKLIFYWFIGAPYR